MSFHLAIDFRFLHSMCYDKRPIKQWNPIKISRAAKVWCFVTEDKTAKKAPNEYSDGMEMCFAKSVIWLRLSGEALLFPIAF